MEFIEDSTDSEDEEVIDKVKADVETNTTKSKMYKQPSVTNRNGHTIRASIIFQIGDKNEDKKKYLGLLDSGSTGSLINAKLVQEHNMEVEEDNSRWTMNNGQFDTSKKAKVKNMKLSQVSNKRVISSTTMSINPSNDQQYKAIFGLDFLINNQIDILCSSGEINWQGICIPLNAKGRQILECESYKRDKMQKNHYKAMTAKEIILLDNQQHLSNTQKEQMERLLKEFEDLFQGRVGNYRGNNIKFELKPGIQPFYSKPYSIPVSLLQLTKDAIQEMIEQGVLREAQEDTNWAAPTFCVPKKTKGVRVVSNFRALNRSIKRSPWPMPSTRDLLHRVGGMTYVTALDQILSYYTVNIDQKL